MQWVRVSLEAQITSLYASLRLILYSTKIRKKKNTSKSFYNIFLNVKRTCFKVEKDKLYRLLIYHHRYFQVDHEAHIRSQFIFLLRVPNCHLEIVCDTSTSPLRHFVSELLQRTFFLTVHNLSYSSANSLIQTERYILNKFKLKHLFRHK